MNIIPSRWLLLLPGKKEGIVLSSKRKTARTTPGPTCLASSDLASVLFLT